MSWLNRFSVVLPFLAGSALAGEGYVLGAGVEADTEDGFAITAMGGLGLSERTWLSAAIAQNTAPSPIGEKLETVLADLAIDHWWQPLGIRAGVAYWGDNDTLDSVDLRASVYWRGDRFSVAGDYEHRDFGFLFPGTDLIPGREVDFGADGIGLSGRVELSDSMSLGFSGIDYEYDVNLKLDRNRPLLQLLSYSRLSLINSLVDYRATASLSVDVGERNWQFDAETWKGEVDGSISKSATVRYLSPIGERNDIEFALGVDHSEQYGTVTFFSVFVFFYGGNEVEPQ